MKTSADSFWRLTTLVVVAISTSLQAQTMSGPAITTGRRVLELHLTPGISNSEIDQYSDLLVLSDAQSPELRRVFEAYRVEDHIHRSKEVEPLLQQSSSFAEDGIPFEADSYREFVRERDNLVKALIRREDHLFDSIVAFLGESQVEALPRIRMLRSRIRFALPPTHYPGSHIDLVSLVDEHFKDSKNAAGLSRDAIAPILLEYETVITPLFERRYYRALEAETETKLHQEAARAAGEIDRPEFREARRLLLRPPVQVAKQIHDINVEYVERISEKLGTRVISKRFRELAYPGVFPDPYDLDGLFEELDAIETLSDDDRNRVVAVKSSYRTTRLSIDEKMVRRFVDWSADFAETFSIRAEATQQYLRDMNEYQRSRVDNAKLHFDQIRPIVDQVNTARLLALVQAVEQVLDAPPKPMRPTFGFSR